MQYSQSSELAVGTVCQACGVEAPTRHVVFYQNIGALVMRWRKSIEADLCRACIDGYFWQFTLITAVLGWWGVFSFFTTLYTLPNNIIRFLGTRGMPGVPTGATPVRAVRHVGTVVRVLGAAAGVIVVLTIVGAASGYADRQAQRSELRNETTVLDRQLREEKQALDTFKASLDVTKLWIAQLRGELDSIERQYTAATAPTAVMARHNFLADRVSQETRSYNEAVDRYERDRATYNGHVEQYNQLQDKLKTLR